MFKTWNSTLEGIRTHALQAIHEISTCGDRMKNTLPVDQSRGSETILKKEYDVVGKMIKLL